MTDNRCKKSEANREITSEEAHFAALAARYGLKLRANADRSRYQISDPVNGWVTDFANLSKVEVLLALRRLLVLDAKPASELVRRAAQEAGSQKALAERIGVSESYVSDVIRGRRGASEALMRKLGLKAVTVYVKEVPDA